MPGIKRRVTDNLVIENARILFRNFSGREVLYNPSGNRNFCVEIESAELAKKLADDGWNIRWTRPSEDNPNGMPYLQVAISYDNFPPKILQVTSKNKVLLDPETVAKLDGAEIESADVIIRPYNWEVNGKAGVKAYLRSMYVKIVEDELYSKYSEIPDGNQVFS